MAEKKVSSQTIHLSYRQTYKLSIFFIVLFKRSFPKLFKAIEGKQYTCTLEITEENVKQRFCLYTASDIFEEFEVVENSENHTENIGPEYQNSEVCDAIHFPVKFFFAVIFGLLIIHECMAN